MGHTNNKEQVSEVYRVGNGYSDYSPEQLNRIINNKISEGWKVVSMVSIKGESKSSVVVVYERDVVEDGEKIQI
jgi:hypothetical protein